MINDRDSWDETRRRLRTFNTLFAEVDLIGGLKFKVNVGLDYSQDEYNRFEGVASPFVSPGASSEASLRNRDDWGYTIENILQYDKSFGQHTIGLTGLFSVQEQETQRSGFEAQDIFSDLIGANNFFLAGLASVDEDQFDYQRWGLVSYMGRANYSFDNRFVLTATIRVDGSSRLAEGNKYFTYPAFAAAWNLSNESFMAESSVFDNLRIRAGWGRTSNQAVAPYSSLGRLERSLYQLGGNSVSGFSVTNLPNPNLSWEFTTSQNIGIDFGLFNYRLTGSIDYYRTSTDGVLQSRDLPATSGVPNPIQENIGETEGSGIEIALGADIIRSNDKGFEWGLDVNFTSHREEIVALGNGVEQNIGNGWFVGSPINVIYDYEKLGIWQLGEEDAATQFGDYAPGDIKVADLNGNGVQDGEDRKILGQLDPKWTMGLSTRLGFNNFDLSIVGFANVGNMLISTYYQGNTILEARRNAPLVDYWTDENPTNSFPRPGDQDTRHHQTLGYFDGSFFKIRTINLGYTFDQKILGDSPISGARIYLTVNNPFQAFFSDYVDFGGIDPEPTGRSNSYGRRLVVGTSTPLTRQVILGVNFSL